MPKLSVSIPDDLWDEATTLAGGEKGASQVIQEALRREVEERRAVTANLVGDDKVVADERFDVAIAVIRDAAREEFRSGYELALEWVEDEGYDGLRYARLVDWEIEEVLAFGDPPERWGSATLEELDNPWNEIHRDGFVRALQDCWQAIRSGVSTTNLRRDPDASESAATAT